MGNDTLMDVVAKYYFISDCGEIYSIKSNKILKVWGSGGKSGTKYLKFSPYIQSRKVRVYVHQLQAYVKFGNFNTNIFDIDHIDLNPRNNSKDNIRLLTKVDNRSRKYN